VRRLIVCLALAFAACGGGEDTGVGLRLSDFPSGWTEYGKRDTESTCKSIVAAKQTATDYDRSPDFEKREGMIATSSVFVYKDEAAARAGFRTLAGEITAKCLAGSLGAPRATRFEIAAAGDERTALRATVPATRAHPGGVFDLVFVRAGNGVAQLVLAGVKFPFDAHLREQLTAKVAERLKTT
jgi:hypothetical protein